MSDGVRLATGLEVRLACRRGEWAGPTAGLAPNHAQANLVILPRSTWHLLGFPARPGPL